MAPTRVRLLTVMLVLEIALLGLQFMLGMYLALFVTLPATGSGMMSMMNGGWSPALMGHMMTGWGLGLVALLSVVFAVVSRKGLLVVTTGASLASVAGAGIAGMDFLGSGQNNVFSYVMAIGFLLAFVFAFVSLVLALPATRLGTPAPTPSAVDILGARYARSEVSRDAYLRIGGDLEGHPPA